MNEPRRAHRRHPLSNTLLQPLFGLLLASLILVGCQQSPTPTAPGEPRAWILTIDAQEPLQALEATLSAPSGTRLLHVGSDHGHALVMGHTQPEGITVALVSPSAIAGPVATLHLELPAAGAEALSFAQLSAYSGAGEALAAEGLSWNLTPAPTLTPVWSYRLSEAVERILRSFQTVQDAP